MSRRQNALILAALSGMAWLIVASLTYAALADRTDLPRPSAQPHRSWSMKVTDGDGWTILGAALLFDHPVSPPRRSWAFKIVLEAAGRSVEAGFAVHAQATT